MAPDVLPGFIAVTDADALARAVPTGLGISTVSCGPVRAAYWGMTSLTAGSLTLALSPVVRTTRSAMPLQMVADHLQLAPAALMRLLPPLAAASGSASGVVLVADSMGFRQTYHTTPDAAGASALATSALHAAQAHGSCLDETALAVQSLLGWQLGQRTLFTGVEKLAPGVVGELTVDGVTLHQPAAAGDRPISLQEAVRSAADLLRHSLEAVLDDHPDAVLQLTGGQDSRLLLSAIPRTRRRGLRAMTLGVSGGDVEVATELAARYGLRHEVHGLDGLDNLSDAEAWRAVRTAALRLDGMADPVALAALTIGESSFEQGVRISGLGGEVARGFYYLGRVREHPVTSGEARQLAAWRMFANESVEADLLDPDYSAWAHEVAQDEVLFALTSSGQDWDRATDELYLRHRMQRWAGVTDTAVAYQRTVINPMLDNEFLSIAGRLRPVDKANSLFLARLQMELDPELGRIPLEGRPAPIRYAQPGLRNTLGQRLALGRRLAHKVIQRMSHRNRPPAGGDILAHKVVAHWRRNPGLLSAAGQSHVVRADWLTGMLDGTIRPRPSSVAFLTNLTVATEATRSGRPATERPSNLSTG